MRANIEFDESNYISHFQVDDIDGTYEVPEDFIPEYVYCYKLVDGSLVLDDTKRQEQDTLYDNQETIAQDLRNLYDTDYVIVRAFENILTQITGNTTFEQFRLMLMSKKTDPDISQQITDRENWREEIERLEPSSSTE